MLSTIFEIIGMITVGVLVALLILAAMGAVIMCAGHDEEDEIGIFGFVWGWSNTDDEYL